MDTKSVSELKHMFYILIILVVPFFFCPSWYLQTVYPAGTKLGVLVQKNKTRNSQLTHSHKPRLWCLLLNGWKLIDFILCDEQITVMQFSLRFFSFGCYLLCGIWYYRTQLWSGAVKSIWRLMLQLLKSWSVWLFLLDNTNPFIMLQRWFVILLGTDRPFDLDVDAYSHMF
jgi:hypothetical protein